MLSMQQCIDLCDLTPEEAKALRDRATLTEILAIQSECQASQAGQAPNPDAMLECRMLRMRDQLLDEVEAADDFDELERVVHHYCAYAQERDAEFPGGPDGA